MTVSSRLPGLRRVVILAAALLCAAAFAAPSPPAGRFEHEGVAVEFTLLPASGAGESAAPPQAGDFARARFSITDTTTGQPLRKLRPAAWLSRRSQQPDARPQTCAEKVRELLGGSIFSKADLDLNTFQVLALNDDATLTVVDPLFGFGGTKLLAMISLPGPGADWALAPDNSRLFVSIPSTSQIAVIDPSAWKMSALLDTGSPPSRVAFQPDGHFAWVATATGAVVIDVARATLVRRLPQEGGVREIVFSDDSRTAFLTGAAIPAVNLVDVRTLEKTRQIALDGVPAGAAWSQAGQALYLADPAAGALVVIDPASPNPVVARIAAEPGLGEVKFAPGERLGLVAVPSRDLVLVFDAATNRLVQRAAISHAPEQFAFSGELAFVRRRGTANVGMIPLKELGREGRALPVAEFTGGEAPFGERSSPADSIVPASGESAVVVANPADKAIYYYMPGMAAPMGNFGNYDRQPRAVLVVDRSLREVAPGIYESAVRLPAAGDYDAVFFLDAPRIAQCLALHLDEPPSASPARRAPPRFEPLGTAKLVAGSPARLAFRLSPAGEVPADLTVLAMLAPGAWHSRLAVTRPGDGSFSCDFTPPEAGLYYFYAASPSLGLERTAAPVLVQEAAAP